MALCFFDISIGNAIAGRVYFELFDSDCPLACENFRALCTGEKGKDPITKSRLHYRGSIIHRVQEGFLVQGGDLVFGNGKGGVSIFGGRFADESFKHKHVFGALSLANSGPNTNGSQFFICLNDLKWLDGKHVVFGRVVKGMEIIEAVGKVDRQRSDLPVVPIVITTCGIVETEEQKVNAA
eukprot:PhF_6_TR41530/c0_g1_i1/m.62918